MMLRPHDMSKVIVTGPKKVQENVIKELHRLKIMHIVEHLKNDAADIGNPLQNAGALSEIIVKIRSLINTLGIKKEDISHETKNSLTEIELNTNKISLELNKINEEQRKIEELRSKNQLILNDLRLMENIDLPLEAFQPYKSLEILTGYIQDSYDLSYLNDSLLKTTDKFQLLNTTISKKIFIILFIDADIREKANKILQKLSFIPVNIANLGNHMLDHRKNAAFSIKKIELQIQKLDYAHVKKLEQQKKLAEESKNFLITAEEILSDELEKAEAPLKFAATKDVFLIKGWIPTQQLEITMEILNKTGKNKIYIHSEPANPKDSVPIKLKNSKYSKPFEFFIKMYSLPTYKEIDPTFFMFLTYPLFFGFMLGDFGYGIVSFALFYYLKKKIPKGAALFNVMLLSSIASIFFGFIYGEVFGLEEIGHFAIPHLISRSHGIFELMYISIAIGVIHINWGLITGFINLMKAHGIKHAIFEKGSWFVLQIGILLLAVKYLNIAAIPQLIGWLFFVISIIMLYKGEGMKGIIELPSIMTNILSYLRLMAIGLSSVSIAVVVNEIAAGFFQDGGLGILSGILILFIGHTLNIVLGLFGSFLHSLRLHYVEFFSKFFEGGAEKYNPFGMKEE
jgi:V/A-type H+/Na+-transporting ATPase subunit I